MKSVLAIITLAAAVAARYTQEACIGLMQPAIPIKFTVEVPSSIMRDELAGLAPDHQDDVENWLFRCDDDNDNQFTPFKYCDIEYKENEPYDPPDTNEDCGQSPSLDFGVQDTRKVIHVKIEV